MTEAILYVSFGGPEAPEDVMPFLENVTRGRGVPPERLAEVAEHYHHCGGKSPINDQNRAVIADLRKLLEAEGPALPVYWGNRNWHPYLADTLRQMKQDGVRKVYAFMTSAYSSYSGCRQYRENIDEAKRVAEYPELEVAKLRVFFNHPGFVTPQIERVQAALAQLPAARLVFTAHSIPQSMAQSCRYEEQLGETARVVASASGQERFDLVWQSRSGPPSVPWLEPDILGHLRQLKAQGETSVILAPIGFVSDHLEVLYDLDTEAKDLAAELGLGFLRVSTVSGHPSYVAMIRELVLERMGQAAPRTIGLFGPSHDVCPQDCCLPPRRPATPGQNPERPHL
jgi:ferrochelatase